MTRKPRTTDTESRSAFCCCACDRTLPLARLSRGTLTAAGTDDPRQAALTLSDDDLLCQACENADADEIAGEHYFGRNLIEAFEFDGLRLDPGKLAAHLLNY